MKTAVASNVEIPIHLSSSRVILSLVEDYTKEKMFDNKKFCPNSYPSEHFSRNLTSKISTGQRDVYYINDHLSQCGSQNSLLFRSAFVRYLKKRRPILVVLMCVILISLSYLFTVSGGLQFKTYKMKRDDLSTIHIEKDELLKEEEEVSIQYSKLKRLNHNIQNVVSYGRVSLLNNDDSILASDISPKDTMQSISDNKRVVKGIYEANSRLRRGKSITNRGIDEKLSAANGTIRMSKSNRKMNRYEHHDIHSNQ